MKKWFAVLCLSTISVMAFAQTNSQTTGKKKQYIPPRSIMSDAATKDGNLVIHSKEFEADLERQFKKAQKEAKKQEQAPTQAWPKGDPYHDTVTAAPAEQSVGNEQAQPQTPTEAWPQVDDYHGAVAAAPSSDRPSYYANDPAYANCKEVEICQSWALQQAQKDAHFSVSSAQFSEKLDHNRRLEVRYIKEGGQEKVQVFEENYGSGWSQVN